jgi:prevent-host-death family protein
MEVKEVSVYEAKTHLSKFLREVEAGEEIIIKRGKKKIAKLIPAESGDYTSAPDTASGDVWMSEDFNAPLDAFTEYRK